MVTRTTLTLPPDHELDTGGGAGPLAISPDGQRVAYVATAGGRTGLYVTSSAIRSRSQAIPGTEGAQYPFFAPDGESVAFFADRKLKRVSIRGGSPLIGLRCRDRRTRWHMGRRRNDRVRPRAVWPDACCQRLAARRSP